MNTTRLCIKESKILLSQFGRVEVRSQFGGYALFIDKVVFALVKEDGLYLRASSSLNRYIQQFPLQRFIFYKKGYAIALNYYRVNQRLWYHTERLKILAWCALQEARLRKEDRTCNLRLKNLPNMSAKMESALKQVGITTVSQLRAYGAKQCWLMLYARNVNIGLITLYALQGAISGQHQAVLDPQTRNHLQRWFTQYQQNQTHRRYPLSL